MFGIFLIGFRVQWLIAVFNYPILIHVFALMMIFSYPLNEHRFNNFSNPSLTYPDHAPILHATTSATHTPLTTVYHGPAPLLTSRAVF